MKATAGGAGEAVQQSVTRLLVRARPTSGGGAATNIHGCSGSGQRLRLYVVRWVLLQRSYQCVWLAAKLELSATLTPSITSLGAIWRLQRYLVQYIQYGISHTLTSSSNPVRLTRSQESVCHCSVCTAAFCTVQASLESVQAGVHSLDPCTTSRLVSPPVATQV